MFFIVNKTRSSIVIKDIGITLGPKQAIDLDKVISREKSNNSKHLRLAKSQGSIEIRRKDETVKHSNIPTEKTDNNLNSLKNEIVGEVKNMMESMSKELNKNQGINENQLENILKKVVQSIPKNETVIIKENNNLIPQDEEIEIDENILVDMNKRVVNKIVKDAKVKSVKYKEEIQENTILSNIDELENLLG